MGGRSFRLSTPTFLLLLFAASLLPILPNFGSFMIVSDAIWIYDGKHLSLDGLFAPNSHSTVRPLLTLFFAVCYRLFHLKIDAYYAALFLSHLLVAVLVWQVGRRLLSLFGQPLPEMSARISALTFAVYFPHHQAVFLIATIHDTLMTALLLLAALVLLRPSQAAHVGASALLFAASLLVKEPAIGFFPVFPVLLFLSAPGSSRRARIVWAATRSLPFVLILLAWAIFLIGHVLPQQNVVRQASPWEIVATNLTSYREMLLTSIPFVSYRYFELYRSWFPFHSRLFDLCRLAFVVFTAAAIILGPLRAPRRGSKPKLPWGLLIGCGAFFAVTYAPSTLSKEAVWEDVIHMARFRFYYLPSVGPCLILGWFFGRLLAQAQLGRLCGSLALSGFLAAHGIATYFMAEGYRESKANFGRLAAASIQEVKAFPQAKQLLLVAFPEGHRHFYELGVEPVLDLFLDRPVRVQWVRTATGACRRRPCVVYSQGRVTGTRGAAGRQRPPHAP